MAQTVSGILIGTVRTVDPALAQVEVRIHEREHETYWAPIAAPMSGRGRGAYFMPEEGDEVVLGFDRGEFDHPYVLGFLWSEPDTPPRSDRRIRVFRSVNGHEIAFYDPEISAGDRGYVRISDAHGNQIELANGRISVTGIGAIEIKAPVVEINGRVVSPVGPPI